MYGPPAPPGMPAGGPAPRWGGGHSATVGVGRDDLVSGEAVALDLPAANLGLRVLSGLIDLAVGWGTYYLLQTLVFAMFADVDDAFLAAMSTVAMITALVGIPTALETATRGKTLGHLALGLRTVRDDAGPIAFRHALTRALLGVVELYACGGFPAFVAAVVNRKGKRIGDLVAGTYVIRDRYRIKLPTPPAMPEHLRAWASTADIAPMPYPLTIAVRQFLGRRSGLDLQARGRLAQDLLYRTAPYVAPAPPPAAAEDVLSAVLAERRVRDAVRIDRDTQLRDRLVR